MKTQENYQLLFERKRVYVLFNQNPIFLLGLLACMLSFIFVSWKHFPAWQLLAWLGASILVLVIRAFLVKAQLPKINTFVNLKDIHRAENLYVMGSFASALLWTFATTYFLSEEIVQQAFVGYIIAGMTAAVTAGYASSPKTYFVFLLPTTLPFLVAISLYNTPTHFAMALMLTFFTSFLALTYKTMNKFSTDSLRYDLDSKKMLNDLTAKQSDLAYTSRMATLGELSANIAHEINNPLAILKTGIQMLTQDIHSEHKVDRKYCGDLLDRLNRTTDRISDTINALRAFSQDNKEIQYESINLKDLINENLSIANEKYRSAGIHLNLDTDLESLNVHCYPAQIRQVVLNLINNAFDAIQSLDIKEEKWVRIKLIEDDEKAVIKVTDAGKGIPKDIQKNIFIPFYSTKKGMSGTGLGLAMASGIINKHNGKIWVNNDSKNTEFVIELPKNPGIEISEEKAS